MYIDVHVKHQLLLFDFNEAWIFSTDFRKILKYQMKRKSVQREPSCSMRTARQTDRQTDRSQLTLLYRNFTHLKITLFAE